MLKEFPGDSFVHHTFQRWIELGILNRIRAALIEGCEGVGGGAKLRHPHPAHR